MLSESEAWMLLHDVITGAPDAVVRNTDGRPLSGLCSAVYALRIDGLISRNMEGRMINRIYKDLGLKLYLHTPFEWADQVRAKYCLLYADRADRSSGRA